MSQVIKAGRTGPGQVLLPPRQPAASRVVQPDDEGRVVIKRSISDPAGTPPPTPE